MIGDDAAHAITHRKFELRCNLHAQDLVSSELDVPQISQLLKRFAECHGIFSFCKLRKPLINDIEGCSQHAVLFEIVGQRSGPFDALHVHVPERLS